MGFPTGLNIGTLLSISFVSDIGVNHNNQQGGKGYPQSQTSRRGKPAHFSTKRMVEMSNFFFCEIEK